ncbi:hypothetical protein MTR67_044908, partial [Solanum verrucosum]
LASIQVSFRVLVRRLRTNNEFKLRVLIYREFMIHPRSVGYDRRLVGMLLRTNQGSLTKCGTTVPIDGP